MTVYPHTDSSPKYFFKIELSRNPIIIMDLKDLAVVTLSEVCYTDMDDNVLALIDLPGP
jgi:hypothetical protein